MPLIPNLIEHLLLFRLNRGQDPLFDVVAEAALESVLLALKLFNIAFLFWEQYLEKTIIEGKPELYQLKTVSISHDGGGPFVS